MTEHKNDLGQPISFSIDSWQPCDRPSLNTMMGRTCRLETYSPDKHNQQLFNAFIKDTDQANWTYLPYGPFDNFADFDAWARAECQNQDPLFHTVIDLKTEQAVGLASYLRITPETGVIEVGHIHFSPLMQGTTLATETMFLMMQRVFDELGYRRYEWKCDSLNAPSCRAAQRLGFQFEGIFRQLTMYKGRNRDTAWFAIIDKDWLMVKSAFQQWLSVDNFDQQGEQKQSLSEFMSK